ncbi:MAG: hypothetical protein JWR38_4548 [Mucilaginibacter sp.]|nr:hypothetical protein [Mucilaginibacter sp.]
MKNLKLDNLGVQEMNAVEMTDVNGGGWGDIFLNINLQPVLDLVAGLLTSVGGLLKGLLGL